jgi:UDP-N-acetylmuramate--alanine ligase
MKLAPQKALFFVGIGGIGMSGIAEVLFNQGFSVRGSDAWENANVKRLRELGVPVSLGHSAQNIRGVQALVVSSAIPDTNEELTAAREHGIPVLTRGEMLAEMMRAKKAIAISGTHGKTTTTSLVAALLSEAGRDPTVINGGIINTYKTNAKLGTGEWIVAEADESDGSFLKLPCSVNIVTNIDKEHLNYYKTEEDLEKAFQQFVRNLPFYGLSILGWDHPRVQKLFASRVDRRFVTYGFGEGPQRKEEAPPHFKPYNVRSIETGTLFDIEVDRDFPFLFGPVGPGVRPAFSVKDVFIPLFGQHNVLNATAAFAAACELNISPAVSIQGFATFQGVKRRFTILGKKRGITFVDDYAHHPEEIRAVLQATRQTKAKRVFALFQPHRYSRFSSLFSEFAEVLKEADGVLILPVYSAGEPPLDGCEPARLEILLKQKGCPLVGCAQKVEDMLAFCEKEAQCDDFVVGLGAGNISEMMLKLYGSF